MQTLVMRGYGRTVALVVPPLALAMARERLPPSYRVVDGPAERKWEVCKRRDGGWSAAVEGGVLGVLPDLDGATELALSDLQLWVAEWARDRVFVHAGCVVAHGRAIVLPGRSMSGKSSLTAALVRAGAAYYSDEYAVMDNHGLVRPYPRILSIRPYDGAATRRVAVDELGGRVGRGPAVVGVVANLRYDPAGGWQPEPLTPGQALLRLLDNTIPARSRPRAVLSALSGAATNAHSITGTRGDADEAARVLLAMVSS